MSCFDLKLYARGLTAVLLILSACGKDAGGEGDSNDLPESGPNAQEALCADYPENIACPTLPAPPQLEDGTDFSEWEPSQCPAGAMPDFGQSGCIVIGDPCPEGAWPEFLPTNTIRYVTPGGTGDGLTKETAAGSIQAMLSSTTSGATIALSKGRFEEHFEIARRQHVVGACARDTVIIGRDRTKQEVVAVTGSGESSLQNLSVTGDQVGVWVFNAGAEVEVRGVSIEGTTRIGMIVSDASLTATMLSIRDTQPLPNGSYGWGMDVNGGAQVKVSKSIFSGNHVLGVFVTETGTNSVLEDVLILDTKAQERDSKQGWGLNVQMGAAVTVLRGYLSGNREVGAFVNGDGTDVVLEDLIIRETLESEFNSAQGYGMKIVEGARLKLSRGYLSRNRDIGALVQDANTSVSFEDLVIEDTQPRVLDGFFGRGLEVTMGSEIAVTRARFSRNRDLGVMVASLDTTALLEDVVIEDTRSFDSDGTSGRGLNVQYGSTVEITRGLVRRNREQGVFIASEGTRVSLSESVVTETRVALCEEDPALDCPSIGQGYGDGILVMGGAHLELSSFEITQSPRVGLHLYDTEGTGLEDVLISIVGSPTLEVRRGEIHDNQYGINLRGGNITPADFAGKEVACYDNESTIDGCYIEMNLEVPSPSDSLEGVTKK